MTQPYRGKFCQFVEPRDASWFRTDVDLLRSGEARSLAKWFRHLRSSRVSGMITFCIFAESPRGSFGTFSRR
jgi:hypothetical protein